MKKVAIFGNTGGGKSTLARRLAELTRLPLYPLDLIQYRPGGGEVPRQDYLRAHADLLDKDEWIIDGLGCVASVTKRLIKALFARPEGWPENSPVWESTINSYKVVWGCHRRLTPRYRQLVADVANSKRVHHIKSPTQIAAFLNAVERECGRA